MTSAHAMRVLSCLCLVVTLVATARGQTATRNLTIGGGTGFSGTLAGNITADVKLQSSNGSQLTFGHLDVQDLDIATVSGGGSFNTFPNSVSHDNTGAAVFAIAPTTIGIDIPTAPFGSPVGGSITVTAGDHRADIVAGVIDPGTSGSDGAWDDPGQSGILNGAAADGFNVALSNDLNMPANVSGQIAAAFPTNVTIPNVVNTSAVKVDLVVKNSSVMVVDFDDVQNLSIKDLTLSTSQPIALPLAQNNFNESTHPTGYPQLDLSAGGIGFVETMVSGTLSADITATVLGSIDLQADVTVAGLFGFSIPYDDAINGVLSTGSLLELNQSLSLPDVELPFLISVLHEPTMNVDFDDVRASLFSGTLGLTLPFSFSQQDLVIPLPATGFQVSNQFFPIDQGPLFNGTVWLQHLQAELGGQLVLDLNADLELSAELLADAFAANAINVNAVPEPGGVILAGLGFCGAAVLVRRRSAARRRRSPAPPSS